MFSLGCFSGVWLLIADVSEPFIGSIFLGSLMQYDSGWDVWGIYTWQVQALINKKIFVMYTRTPLIRTLFIRISVARRVNMSRILQN
jgi:hypothetical protein